MSRAEELSQNRYPTFAEKYAFIDGYEQAEKNLALTWKDIKLIWNITDEMDNMPEEEFYQEVLNRFNKERKNKLNNMIC